MTGPEAATEPGFWERARELFDAVVDLPPAERQRALERHSAGEPALRAALEALLEADLSDSRQPLGESAVAAAVEEAFDRLRLERALGPYRLLAKLGSGGMGSVYLATQRADPGRRVAVKLLRPGAADPGTLRRFERERQVLGLMAHPNIARLLDGGVSTDGQPYLVMEWLDGEPVTAYCEQRRLTLSGRLRLVAAVASGLQHAHQHLIVHRDIKPGNILVSKEGVPKILDFGIAKLLADRPPGQEPPTVTLLPPLTPTYASPEQLAGAAVGTASDLYSLAVVTFELLAGRPPAPVRRDAAGDHRHLAARPPISLAAAFAAGGDGADASERRRRLAAERQTTVDALQRWLAGDLDRVLAKALAEEPGERYASVAHFAEDLQRALEGRPVAARPATALYHFRRFVRRNAWRVAAAALAGASILALSASLWVQSSRLGEERDRARQEQQRAAAARDFLVALFKNVDPHRPSGRPFTLREMLSLGEEQLGLGAAGDPALKAALWMVIARAHQNLGDLDRAARGFEQALLLRQELATSQPASVTPGEIAASLDAVGEILRLKGEFEVAAGYSRRALELRRDLLGPRHELVADSLDNLAEALHELGSYDEAEPLYREVLAIRRERFGDRDLRVATGLDHYGLLLRNRGRAAEARAAHQEGLEIRQALLPPHHPDLARSHFWLGLVSTDLGPLDEAERHYRQALEIFQSAYGGDHADIASCLHDLGALESERQRFAAAQDYLEAALAMRRRIYSGNHPELVQTLALSGSVWLDRGEPMRAKPLIEEALARSVELFGREHVYTAVTELYRGRLEAAMGQAQAAVVTVAGALALLERLVGPRHPLVARAETQLGEHLQLCGRQEEAARHFESGYDVYLTLLGADHADTRRARGLLEASRGNRVPTAPTLPPRPPPRSAPASASDDHRPPPPPPSSSRRESRPAAPGRARGGSGG